MKRGHEMQLFTFCLIFLQSEFYAWEEWRPTLAI